RIQDRAPGSRSPWHRNSNSSNREGRLATQARFGGNALELQSLPSRFTGSDHPPIFFVTGTCRTAASLVGGMKERRSFRAWIVSVRIHSSESVVIGFRPVITSGVHAFIEARLRTQATRIPGCLSVRAAWTRADSASGCSCQFIVANIFTAV